jgi:predicted PurR-regulated permease PerM
VPKGLAAGLALLVGLGALAGLVTLVVDGIRDEWDDLSSSALEGLAELQRTVTDLLPIDTSQLERAQQAAVDALTSASARSQALGGAAVAAEVVTGAFLMIVILFFLLKDGPSIWRFLLRPVPEEQRSRAQRIGDRSLEVLGGYVRGTTVIALVDAIVIGVALALLGVPLALPLAVVVFLGAYVPLAGATIAGALAALVALVTNGPVTALIVVAVVIVVNQVEGDVLAPVVLGKALALHPLAVLLALTAGVILAGIIGAVLAVPLVAVLWTVVTSWDEG